MLKKIDEFCNRILKWKVLKYLLLGDLFLLPYTFIVYIYNIPLLFRVIIILSVSFSVANMTIAFKNIIE